MAQHKTLETAIEALKVEQINLIGLFEKALTLIPSRHKDILEQQKLLRKLNDEFDTSSPITIALLGDTGHGKSTLANSIIGQEILPVSFSQVCTAGITRIKYSNIEGFKGTIKYLSKSAIEGEIESARLTLSTHDPKLSPDTISESDLSITNETALLEVTRTRLKAIFGVEQFQEFIDSFGRYEFTYPDEILRVLTVGTESISAESSKEFKNLLQQYLVVPKRRDAENQIGAVWAVVQEVLVQGPFHALASGAQIVDLPGLNDPNPAREAVTTEYLREAKFIAIVFRFVRGISKDVKKALEPRDLLRNLLIAGRTNALTFVMTYCDAHQLTEETVEVTENPGLSIAELMYLINENFRNNEFPAQLQQLAEDLIPGNNSQKEIVDLRNAFAESAVFMTSAQDFLNIEKSKRNERVLGSQVFTDKSQTGILELRKHFEILSVDAGPRMLVERIKNKMINATQPILIAVNSELMSIELSNTEHASAFRDFIGELSESTKRINGLVESYLIQHKEYLQQQTKSFLETITTSPLGVAKIQNDFKIYLESISHWRTLKAVMQHGGIFYSTGPKGLIDVKAKIKDPIFESAFGPWVRYFQGTLNESIESTRDGLLNFMQDYVSELSDKFPRGNQYQEIRDSLLNILNQIADGTLTNIQEVQSSLDQRIPKTRNQLGEIINSSVNQELDPAIAESSLESGPGMTGRIRSILNNRALGVIENSFTITRTKISEEVYAAINDVNEILENSARMILGEVNNFAAKFNQDPLQPSAQNNDDLVNLRNHLQNALGKVGEVELYSSYDRLSNFPPADINKSYMVMDGSNLSTYSTKFGRKIDLNMLLECRACLIAKFPDREIITLVDSNYYKFLDRQSNERLSILNSQGIVNVIPSGINGGGDKYILKMVREYDACVVCKSDAYRQHEIEHPFIREPGRRLTALRIGENEWHFQFE